MPLPSYLYVDKVLIGISSLTTRHFYSKLLESVIEKSISVANLEQSLLPGTMDGERVFVLPRKLTVESSLHIFSMKFLIMSYS